MVGELGADVTVACPQIASVGAGSGPAWLGAPRGDAAGRRGVVEHRRQRARLAEPSASAPVARREGLA